MIPGSSLLCPSLPHKMQRCAEQRGVRSVALTGNCPAKPHLEQGHPPGPAKHCVSSTLGAAPAAWLSPAPDPKHLRTFTKRVKASFKMELV